MASEGGDVGNLKNRFEKLAAEQKPGGKTKQLAGCFERKIENQSKSAAKMAPKKKEESKPKEAPVVQNNHSKPEEEQREYHETSNNFEEEEQDFGEDENNY